MCMTTTIMGVCLIAGQITHVDINNDSMMPDVAHSYDGKERSIERFYKPEEPRVSVSGYVITDTNTKFDLGVDTGYRSDKLKQDPALTVGVTQLFTLTEALPYQTQGTGWDMLVGASTTIGGRIKHTSCKDSYDREYFCGNLTAWSDFDKPEQEVPAKATIQFVYSF